MLSQQETNLVYRVLDANYNRAVEGLRATEEYFRFVIEDKKNTEAIKILRHEVCSICKNWIDIWADQRDSESDVGATISAKDEYERSDLPNVVGANLARVNQAIRAMEEYSKSVCPELSPQLEAVRYRFYEVEKDLKRVVFVDTSIGNKSIYVLTSACQSLSEFESRVRSLCEAGADFIQLREKNLDDGVLLERAKSGVNICKNFSTLFIVNDRPDIALMSDADGVHVGQEEFPVQDIRRLFPHGMLIGVSTHTLEQAQKAEQDGADYIGVGPTFPSHTKCFTEFTGTELLQQVAASVSVPAFAIGGINLDNVEQVKSAGFARVAVSGAIHQAESQADTIDRFKKFLEQG